MSCGDLHGRWDSHCLLINRRISSGHDKMSPAEDKHKKAAQTKTAHNFQLIICAIRQKYFHIRMRRTSGNYSETASQSSTHRYRISKKSSWSIGHSLEVKLSSGNTGSSFRNLWILSYPQPEMLSRMDDIPYEIPSIAYRSLQRRNTVAMAM